MSYLYTYFTLETLQRCAPLWNWESPPLADTCNWSWQYWKGGASNLYSHVHSTYWSKIYVPNVFSNTKGMYNVAFSYMLYWLSSSSLLIRGMPGLFGSQETTHSNSAWVPASGVTGSTTAHESHCFGSKSSRQSKHRRESTNTNDMRTSQCRCTVITCIYPEPYINFPLVTTASVNHRSTHLVSRGWISPRIGTSSIGRNVQETNGLQSLVPNFRSQILSITLKWDNKQVGYLHYKPAIIPNGSSISLPKYKEDKGCKETLFVPYTNIGNRDYRTITSIPQSTNSEGHSLSPIYLGNKAQIKI